MAAAVPVGSSGAVAVPELQVIAAMLSDEHFSVDGTLIDAWASMKSFRPKAIGFVHPPDLGGLGVKR